MTSALSRFVIVDAALQLADGIGIERVTMRRVARELGVAPMSLYRHVANKAALFDFMLDRMIQRLMPLEAIGAPWREFVLATARNARHLLGEHPAWLPLFTRPVAPTSALSLFERLAVTMAKEGALPRKDVHAIASLMCFTLGFVLVERMFGEVDGSPIPLAQIRAARVITDTTSTTYPHLRSLAPALDRWSFEEAFEVGVESLVAEIARPRAA